MDELAMQFLGKLRKVGPGMFQIPTEPTGWLIEGSLDSTTK